VLNPFIRIKGYSKWGRKSSSGRQYVVIAAGGDGKAWGWSDQVIAFALQRPAR
jgi:glucose dehydrogenase